MLPEAAQRRDDLLNRIPLDQQAVDAAPVHLEEVGSRPPEVREGAPLGIEEADAREEMGKASGAGAAERPGNAGDRPRSEIDEALERVEGQDDVRRQGSLFFQVSVETYGCCCLKVLVRTLRIQRRLSSQWGCQGDFRTGILEDVVGGGKFLQPETGLFASIAQFIV